MKLYKMTHGYSISIQEQVWSCSEVSFWYVSMECAGVNCRLHSSSDFIRLPVPIYQLVITFKFRVKQTPTTRKV